MRPRMFKSGQKQQNKNNRRRRTRRGTARKGVVAPLSSKAVAASAAAAKDLALGPQQMEAGWPLRTQPTGHTHTHRIWVRPPSSPGCGGRNKIKAPALPGSDKTVAGAPGLAHDRGKKQAGVLLNAPATPDFLSGLQSCAKG